MWICRKSSSAARPTKSSKPSRRGFGETRPFQPDRIALDERSGMTDVDRVYALMIAENPRAVSLVSRVLPLSYSHFVRIVPITYTRGSRM